MSAATDEPGSALRLGGEFPQSSFQLWRAAVDKVLARGGTDLDASELDERFRAELVTTTVDGLTIDPLFVDRGDAPEPGFPGYAPFTRGTQPLGHRRFGWDARQRVLARDDPGEVARHVLDELERGATSIVLDLSRIERVDTDYLDEALAGVQLDWAAIALWAGNHDASAADAMVELWHRRAAADASGSLGLDPVGRWAQHHVDDNDIESALATTVEFADRCAADLPAVRAITVDAALVHESGGGDVEELGYAAACGIRYLHALVGAGLDVDQAASQLEFRYAATPDQFLTIAKLRAARRIWQRIASVSGASTTGQRQFQHAVSSTYFASRYDVWVNVLRGTVECFGAGVGGADAVTVLPHDEPLVRGGSELGRRLARNTQLVLIEESNLARVVDIAGGSWYVEQLTDQLANAAWAFMQQVEAAGGVIGAIDSGMVQGRIGHVDDRRSEAVRHRTLALTGVTEFPNIADVAPLPGNETERPSSLPFPALRRHRVAEPIEHQRARADAITEATGHRPLVFLAALGPPSAHTARSNFAKNLFEVGGIRVVVGEGDGETLRDEFARSGASLACVCSSDAVYTEQALPVVKLLREAEPSRLYLAGRPRGMDDALAAAGVDEQIVAGGDVVDVIRRALDAIEAP